MLTFLFTGRAQLVTVAEENIPVVRNNKRFHCQPQQQLLPGATSTSRVFPENIDVYSSIHSRLTTP